VVESLLHILPLTPAGIVMLIALVAALESLAFVGLLLPGVALLFALAAMAGSSGVSLWICLLAGFAGAACGDGISFLLGRHATTPLLRLKWLKNAPQWLHRGEQFFHRWGGLSIVSGRFVGPIRPIIPFVAGSCGMSGLSFLFFNLISALGWAPLYLLPGYLTGKGLSSASPQLEALLWAGALLLFILLLFQQFHYRLQPQSRFHAFFNRVLPTPWPPGATLLLLVALTVLAIVTLLSFEPTGVRINTGLQPFLKAAGDALPHLALGMTLIGDIPLVAGLALLCALYGQWHGDKLRGWGVVIGVVAVLLLNSLLKELFGLPRPEGSGLTDFSYPSGHAAAATAFFTLTAAWMLHNRPHAVRHLGYLSTIPLILPAPARIPPGWVGVMGALTGCYLLSGLIA